MRARPRFARILVLAMPPACRRATMVPRRGLEPPRPCERQHLKLVRLPIPPPGHGCVICSAGRRRLRARAPALSMLGTAAASAPAHDRAPRRACHRVRRRRIHRPLRLRIPVEERASGSASRSATRARPISSSRWARSASSASSGPTSPTPTASARAVDGAERGHQPGRRVRPADAGASMSTARGTSPRRRARPARQRWSTSRRSAPIPQSESRLRPDQGRRRGGGARGLPERDDHPPVARVRARGRAHQPLRRHGAAAVPSGDRGQAQFPAGLCPRPRARRSPWRALDPARARRQDLRDRRPAGDDACSSFTARSSRSPASSPNSSPLPDFVGEPAVALRLAARARR